MMWDVLSFGRVWRNAAGMSHFLQLETGFPRTECSHKKRLTVETVHKLVDIAAAKIHKIAEMGQV